MDLKLTEHIRNTIFSSLLGKTGEILIGLFGIFLAKKKSVLDYIPLKVNIFRSYVLLRHCDVIRSPIFMILVLMLQWYQTTILLAYQFQVHST